MGFLNFFLGEKKQTATVAKERLQLILAHERNGCHFSTPAEESQGATAERHEQDDASRPAASARSAEQPRDRYAEHGEEDALVT